MGFFKRFFKKVFLIGKLAKDTVEFIYEIIDIIKEYPTLKALEKQGRDIVKRWKELYPKLTK